MQSETGKDLARWWRTPCEVDERVLLCGDLAPHRRAEQLAEWVELGVTDIVDLRSEASDERFVKRHAPSVTYHYLPTDDDGEQQPDAWFDAVVNAGLGALSEPNRVVLYHCHMGVNRAPSAVFALLLALGHRASEALGMIRDARPVAAALYAPDALAWWHKHEGHDPHEAELERAELEVFLRNNHLQSAHVVREMYRASR
jgi:protein-tyrosine phosphatase